MKVDHHVLDVISYHLQDWPSAQLGWVNAETEICFCLASSHVYFKWADSSTCSHFLMFLVGVSKGWWMTNVDRMRMVISHILVFTTIVFSPASRHLLQHLLATLTIFKWSVVIYVWFLIQTHRIHTLCNKDSDPWHIKNKRNYFFIFFVWWFSVWWHVKMLIILSIVY